MRRRFGRAFRVRNPFGIVLVVAAPILLSASTSVRDFWYVHYETALDAIDRGDWETAGRELELALERREESSRRARTYGRRFVRYFPHLYLGLARYNQGRIDEARRLFLTEVEQGEASQVEHHALVLDMFLSAVGDSEVQTPEESLELRAQVAEKVEEGRRFLEAGDPQSAVGAFAVALALDPENEEAAALLERAQEEVIRGEIQRLAPDLLGLGMPRRAREARGVVLAALAPPRLPPIQVPDSEIESRMWETFREGVTLQGEGGYQEALEKFIVVLGVYDAGLLPDGRLREMTAEHRSVVETEIRLAAQAELGVQEGPASDEDVAPRAVIFSPTNLEDPLTGPLVLIQGFAIDHRGVREVRIEVDGSDAGPARIGAIGPGAVRGIGVVRRSDSLGTDVRFNKELSLPEGESRVTVVVSNSEGRIGRSEYVFRVRGEDVAVWAVVIGIDDYSNSGVPDLRFAEADARAFHRYLIDDLGVPEENVTLLTGEDATDSRLRSVLGTDLRRNAEENDQVVVYFAGHGVPDPEDTDPDGDGVEKYLLTVNSDPEDLFGTAIPMQTVSDVLRRIRSERLVFIADACYSGAVGEGGRTFGGSTRAVISDGFLNRLAESGRGRVILTASGANELSHESPELGHGVFTYHLLEGLRGAADGDLNGAITVEEAYSWVTETVPASTNRAQHPVIKRSDGSTGQLILGWVAD